MRTRNLGVLLLLIFCSAACGGPGDDFEDSLESFLLEKVEAADFPYGVAFHIDSPRLAIEWEWATGFADPEAGVAMTPEHPVRIASNTKTYVAAAVLRLWEEGRIDLDDPISAHLPAAFLTTLEGDGYRPDEITVRHLLTHTGGLWDHGASEAYGETIIANPEHRWSRTEQLKICVETGDPQGEPGTVYNYSDTGYILLGEILERLTGENLGAAVWSLVDRRSLGLDSTWFETLEPRPETAVERAHQFFGEVDVTAFDPSFDLWGGGGIATTVGDLAKFTRGLFTGGVYRDLSTLETMLSTFDGLAAAPSAGERSLPPGSYRMGMWVIDRKDFTIYRHTGFWCTSATYVPEFDLVVTGTVNQHQAGELFDEIEEGALQLVIEHSKALAAD